MGPKREMRSYQRAPADRLSAVRLCVVGIRERTVRSSAGAEAIAELAR